MCGITGLLSLQGAPIDPTVLQRMTEPVSRAARNVPWLTVEAPSHVSEYQLLRARQVVFATANEFPGLTAPRNTTDEGVAAAEQLLRRMIWHLQLAGFQAGRQRNPSGVLSNDKLTVFADGAWHAYDVFNDLGAPGVPMKVQFWEVTPPNYFADPGIPD